MLDILHDNHRVGDVGNFWRGDYCRSRVGRSSRDLSEDNSIWTMRDGHWSVAFTFCACCACDLSLCTGHFDIFTAETAVSSKCFIVECHI